MVYVCVTVYVCDDSWDQIVCVCVCMFANACVYCICVCVCILYLCMRVLNTIFGVCMSHELRYVQLDAMILLQSG